MLNVPTRVKDSLKSGMLPKNIRFVVLDENDAELFTIDNNSIVDGSVSFDERLCTGDTLKFGLCEGSSLQFQYFNHENILNKRIQAFIDVQYEDKDKSLKWHSIPMGFYDVDQCPMQYGTGIRKVTAYNKLKSSYLDEDATEDVKNAIAEGDGSQNGTAIISVLDKLLNGFSIDVKPNIKLETNIMSNYNNFFLEIFTECTTERNPVKTGKYFKIVSMRRYLSGSLDSKEFYKIIAQAKEMTNYVFNNILKGKVDESKYYYRGTGTSQSAYPWSYFFSIGEGQPIIDIHLKDGTTKNITLGEYENLFESDWLTNIEGTYVIGLRIPLFAEVNTSTYFGNYENICKQNFEDMISQYPDFMLLYKRNLSDIEKMRLSQSQISDNSKVTLRELQSSTYEMNCEFGQLDRETDLFSGVQLNNERLFPSESLYPSNDLLPTGTAEHLLASSYEKLWTDSQGVQKFKDLIITYKGTKADGTEEEKTLTRTVHSDGTQNYNMSSNWLFKNLVWTEAQVGQYADAMVEKLRNVSWFPFEMWSSGLPYVETGDELEITTPEGTYTSYVLTRTLKGIHDLHDTYINGTLDIF